MSERVLLIDDEKEFVDALAQRMRMRDMQVTTANSAKEALTKVEGATFDAIVVDLRMPEMDGLGFLKAVKETHPEMQIIMLTGYGSVSDSVEAMKLGAMDFLEKPADVDQLRAKIADAKARRMLLVEQKSVEKVQRLIQEKGW